MSNISKTIFLTAVGMPGNSYSEFNDVRERYPMISIAVLSGQREAMLGALQLMLGGSVNAFAEVRTSDDASTPQPDEKQPAIIRPRVSISDLALTDRQLDVLALMMQGKSNKAICRVLNLAEPTVKNHVTAILRALDVSNRTEAVIAVSELGWKSQSTAQIDLRSRIPRPESLSSTIAAPAVS